MRRLVNVLAVVGVTVSFWYIISTLRAALRPSSPERANSYVDLAGEVIPVAGSSVPIHWGDMGQRLIEVGAIDLEKFENQYNGLNPDQREILQGDSVQAITFTRENIQFWTNVLWSLGLTQQSKVLGEGPMMQNIEQTSLGNYASTGGWTLGSRDAVDLYNSTSLITLTPEQDDLVYRVAENIFRPCCGNSTVYPDCNHGMAVLGLLELLAAQGADEQALYQGALAFNRYAFPDTYITLAAYFSAQGTDWTEVDPAVALGPDYSSGQGAQQVVAAVGPIPGSPNQSGSCGT